MPKWNLASGNILDPAKVILCFFFLSQIRGYRSLIQFLARAWAILIGPARGKLADGTWAIVGANETTK